MLQQKCYKICSLEIKAENWRNTMQKWKKENLPSKGRKKRDDNPSMNPDQERIRPVLPDLAPVILPVQRGIALPRCSQQLPLQRSLQAGPALHWVGRCSNCSAAASPLETETQVRLALSPAVFTLVTHMIFLSLIESFSQLYSEVWTGLYKGIWTSQ